MKTFGELLTEYTTRTGISDSELARTLGVRRQTIFRWKEGLVARPRERADVLRMAQRLRLTPEERDTLLLAAGFAPEHLPIPPAAVNPSEPSTLALAPPNTSAADAARALAPIATIGIAEPTVHPTRARTGRRRSGIVALALFLIIGGALFIALRGATPTNYPTAAPGEELVLLGRFANSGGDAPGYDVNARVQAALEREITAARLEKARVAAWPDAIGDGKAAEAARQRAGAILVLWGTFSSDSLHAQFTQANDARSNELPLDALVAAPSNVSLTINSASGEEVQALAQLALAQLYLDGNDFDHARAELTQALSRAPVSKHANAALDFYLGYIYQVALPTELDQAVEFYAKAIDLAPDWTDAYLNRGVAYVRENETQQWQEDFASVLKTTPDELRAQQGLCWAYALDNQPQSALTYCDRAVARDPTARSREPRAIVYAGAGRTTDAIADLQVFLEWLSQQPEGLRSRYGTSRAAWLEALKAGTNPFDAATLNKLRHE